MQTTHGLNEKHQMRQNDTKHNDNYVPFFINPSDWFCGFHYEYTFTDTTSIPEPSVIEVVLVNMYSW